MPAKLAHVQGDVLVFADLGNIGQSYVLLRKRCRQNSCLVFYPYMSFEHLLYGDGVVDCFSQIHLERVYESAISGYIHGAPLSSAYKRLEILDTDVGKLLKEMILNERFIT